MPGITVGIDGSDGAHRALEWAMKEAAAHHAPLTVVTVHEVAASGWTGNPVILPPDEQDVRRPGTQLRSRWRRPPPSSASPSLFQ